MDKPYQIIFLILISIFVKLSMTSPIINDNLHSVLTLQKKEISRDKTRSKDRKYLLYVMLTLQQRLI